MGTLTCHGCGEPVEYPGPPEKNVIGYTIYEHRRKEGGVCPGGEMILLADEFAGDTLEGWRRHGTMEAGTDQCLKLNDTV